MGDGLESAWIGQEIGERREFWSVFGRFQLAKGCAEVVDTARNAWPSGPLSCKRVMAEGIYGGQVGARLDGTVRGAAQAGFLPPGSINDCKRRFSPP